MPDSSASFDLPSYSAAIADRIETAARRVVAVRSGRHRASGIVWRDRYVVTAEESLADDSDVQVFDGETMRVAKVVGRDASTDVALLEVEGLDLRSTDGGEAAAVRPGAWIAVVGRSDDGPLAAIGIVAATGPKWRSMRGGSIDARIELAVWMRGAAEGGLAVDASGASVGMAVFGPRRRSLVIPMTTIARVAERLRRYGRVARGYLGASLQAVRVDGGGLGAMVMSVDADGPAARAGLAQGDVIVRWDGRPFDGVRSLAQALGPDAVDTTATLTVQRGGQAMEVSVVLGERPEPEPTSARRGCCG